MTEPTTAEGQSTEERSSKAAVAATEDDDHPQPTAVVVAAKEKRKADRQITKDDDDNDDDNAGEPTLGFKKANESVLKQRRILKVARDADGKAQFKTTEVTTVTTTKPANPFANTVLVKESISSGSSDKDKKVFGSAAGFSGFGSTVSSSGSGGGGFGSATKEGSSKTTLFGSQFHAGKGFGVTTGTTTSAFGATTATTTTTAASSSSSSSTTTTNLFQTNRTFDSFAGTFGSSFADKPNKQTTLAVNNSTITGSGGVGSIGVIGDNKNTSSSPSASKKVELPKQVKLETGEEEERVLMEFRCRTHKLIHLDGSEKSSLKGTSTTSSTTPLVGAALSVPPSNTTSLLKDTVKENSEQNNSMTLTDKTRWQEIGIGPLRVLVGGPNQLRLVQRRESSPHGPATKVLVNIPIWKETKFNKLSEKHLQCSFPSRSATHEDDVDDDVATAQITSESYLFKFKLAMEADKLQQVLQEQQKLVAKSLCAPPPPSLPLSDKENA